MTTKVGWLSKGQGHDHGVCGVSRRVCEYDLDVVLMGSVFVDCRCQLWWAFSAWLRHHPCRCRCGVVGKRHEDPMTAGANVKCEGHARSASICAIRYISLGPFQSYFFLGLNQGTTHRKWRQGSMDWMGSVGHCGLKNANKMDCDLVGPLYWRTDEMEFTWCATDPPDRRLKKWYVAVEQLA